MRMKIASTSLVWVFETFNIANFRNDSGLVKGLAKAPEIAEEDLNIMMATNVTGLINMTQAILPIYLGRENGGAGDIINIGSIAGREPYIGGSIYCATKAAVRSFTESLRKELIATRIRVMEVDPGQAETVGSFSCTTATLYFLLTSVGLSRSSRSFGFLVTKPKQMPSTCKNT